MLDRDLVSDIYQRHAKTVYRVSFMYVKNATDAEDMLHNVFMKLMGGDKRFAGEEHEKAWLIRTAQNLCKDYLKSAWNKRADIPEKTPAPESEGGEVLQKVLEMPEKYRTPIYLFYYEDYKTAEIAKILKKPESTVRGLLHRGRKILKLELEEEYYGKARTDGGV